MALAELSTKGAMIHAWARADTTPELRDLLKARREESVLFARRLLGEAASDGELPSWIDVDSLASAFITLTNGFVMLANSGTISPLEARREAYAILELLIAAPAQEPESVREMRSATRSGSTAGHG
jgi:hypothetical protein